MDGSKGAGAATGRRTLQEALRVTARHPDGSPAANMPIDIIGSDGAVWTRMMTSADGTVELPSGGATPAELRAEGRLVYRAPLAIHDGMAHIDIAVDAAAPPAAAFFGQVVAPDGSPLGGISVTLRDSGGTILALTVTDPNGAWLLVAQVLGGHPGWCFLVHQRVCASGPRGSFGRSQLPAAGSLVSAFGQCARQLGHRGPRVRIVGCRPVGSGGGRATCPPVMGAGKFGSTRQRIPPLRSSRRRHRDLPLYTDSDGSVGGARTVG